MRRATYVLWRHNELCAGSLCLEVLTFSQCLVGLRAYAIQTHCAGVLDGYYKVRFNLRFPTFLGTK